MDIQVEKKLIELRNLSTECAVTGDFAEIPQSIYFNASHFINILENSYKVDLDPDEISATPWGSITIDIYSRKEKDHFISIEIGESQVGWFCRGEDNESNGEDFFDWYNYKHLFEMIPVGIEKWLERNYY